MFLNIILKYFQCSSKCSTGVQIRKVFCGSLVGETIKKVDSVKCDPSKKYEDTKNCTGKETCKGEWFASPWTAVRNILLLFHDFFKFISLNHYFFCVLNEIQRAVFETMWFGRKE